MKLSTYNKTLVIIILILWMMIITVFIIYYTFKLSNQDIQMMQMFNGIMYNHKIEIEQNNQMTELIRSTLSGHLDKDIRFLTEEEIAEEKAKLEADKEFDENKEALPRDQKDE